MELSIILMSLWRFSSELTGLGDGQRGRRSVRGHEVGQLSEGPQVGGAAAFLHLLLDQHVQLLSERLPAKRRQRLNAAVEGNKIKKANSADGSPDSAGGWRSASSAGSRSLGWSAAATAAPPGARRWGCVAPGCLSAWTTCSWCRGLVRWSHNFRTEGGTERRGSDAAVNVRDENETQIGKT